MATLVAAPFAPIYALLLVAFAQNKVQGLALTKALGVIQWPPMIAYFVESGWQLALGIFPTYWPLKFFWVHQAGEANAWIYLPVGLAYQFLVLAVLLRRFNRVMHQ